MNRTKKHFSQFIICIYFSPHQIIFIITNWELEYAFWISKWGVWQKRKQNSCGIQIVIDHPSNNTHFYMVYAFHMHAFVEKKWIISMWFFQQFEYLYSLVYENNIMWVTQLRMDGFTF